MAQVDVMGSHAWLRYQLFFFIFLGQKIAANCILCHVGLPSIYMQTNIYRILTIIEMVA